MRRTPDGLGPIVGLDRRVAAPLHRQIYEGYRDAIVEGRMHAGQRLPSTRTLAGELGVSRMAVVLAFEQLLAEGYIASRVGAGSFVAALPEIARPARPRARRAARPTRRRRSSWLGGLGAFRLAHPALDELPLTAWTRLLARRARLQSTRQLMYGDPMGLPALREAIADYLRTARSVRCSAEQIMIVSGSQQVLALAARATPRVGRRGGWMEEPGFAGAREALALAGARLVTVPVDDDGLDVAAAIARAPAARAAYVTPSHQYPLGAIDHERAPRRLQLLAWARRTGAWLGEDDYDSEYRYDHEPIASLQGLDPERVIYVGTFSKVLFPALRIGYVVIPDELVARFRRIRAAMDNSPAPLTPACAARTSSSATATSRATCAACARSTPSAGACSSARSSASSGCARAAIARACTSSSSSRAARALTTSPSRRRGAASG